MSAYPGQNSVQMSEIRAIILAAGSSRRMGTQKLLLPYGKSTILETTISHVLDSDIDMTMVVLGADHDRILQTIGHLPVQHCMNENHPDGMLSSVICGLRNVSPGCDAVGIFPGDQPDIPPEIINRIIKIYRQSPQGIIVPVYSSRRGHPLLVDMKYRALIEQLDPDQGLRALLRQHPDDILEIQVDEAGILFDIDDRAAYTAALGRRPLLSGNKIR